MIRLSSFPVGLPLLHLSPHKQSLSTVQSFIAAIARRIPVAFLARHTPLSERVHVMARRTRRSPVLVSNNTFWKKRRRQGGGVGILEWKRFRVGVVFAVCRHRTPLEAAALGDSMSLTSMATAYDHLSLIVEGSKEDGASERASWQRIHGIRGENQFPRQERA